MSIYHISERRSEIASGHGKVYSSGGTCNLVQVSLAPGDRLTYTHGSGWQTINNTGTVKSAGATGAAGAQGSIGPSMAWGGNEVEVDEGLSITYSSAGNPSISSTLKAFLATPTSANLLSAVPDKTGSAGGLVFATSPTLTTPTINTAASVGGTWTAAATWTLPALTLGGTVSGGGQQINNVIIGTVTPLAGFHIALRFRDRCNRRKHVGRSPAEHFRTDHWRRKCVGS